MRRRSNWEGRSRKGAKSSQAILYKSYSKEWKQNAAGEARQRKSVLFLEPMRFSTPTSWRAARASWCGAKPLCWWNQRGREADLDAFFGQIPAALRHSGSAAYYEPMADRITMPPTELFTGFDHYYATLAHELSHWTGHGSRLDRNLKNRFGSAAYAAEELIAELSSAILGAELGLPVAIWTIMQLYWSLAQAAARR